MIRLSISGCLRAGYNNWDNNCNYNRNYVDITVDTTEAPDCVRSLGITGIGYNHTADYNEKNQNQFTLIIILTMEISLLKESIMVRLQFVHLAIRHFSQIIILISEMLQ